MHLIWTTLLAVTTMTAAAWPVEGADAQSASGDGAPAVVYVNNLTGNAAFDGRSAQPAGDGKTGPCATIAQGLAAATVGARIVIANTGTDYRESVRVAGLRKGRAATPLIIEGAGAAVSGLVTVPASLWTPLQADIYYFEDKGKDKPPHMGGMPNSNWLGHLRHQGWFTEPQAPEIFFINGKPAPHVRDLASLPVGGFFYDTQANPRRLYFRLPADGKLDACAIDIPLNGGVFVDDDYVVIRNLISRYSQDDGFAGFWGIGVVFENCNGSFNCDQGISLHGTSTTLIDGGLFERNGGCGIADVMSSITVYRNVVVRDNMIMGGLFAGLAHSLLSCRFSGNYGQQLEAGTGCVINLTNCLIVGSAPAAGAGVGLSMERGRVDHCTVVNCTVGVAIGKGGSLGNSVIAECTSSLIAVTTPALTDCRLWNTVLTGGPLQLGPDKTDAARWSEFSKSTKAATGLIWDTPRLAAPLYILPDASPHAKAGDYQTRPGAVLPPWDAWRPTDAPPAVHPHP